MHSYFPDLIPCKRKRDSRHVLTLLVVAPVLPITSLGKHRPPDPIIPRAFRLLRRNEPKKGH